MASAIWTADLAESMQHLRAANHELVSVLADQVSNSTPVTAISLMHKERMLDGILLNIVRTQSIHKVPLLTAAVSILSEAHLMKREMHNSITFLMKGALLAEASTLQFMTEAAAHRPAPKEPMIPGLMAAAFDNLSMNTEYATIPSSVGGSTGKRLDMTNWFVVRVPQSLAPTLDGRQACVWHQLEPAHVIGTACTHG